MRRLPLLLLLAVLCWPSDATASSRQAVTFEAPRELVSAASRDATLDQIRGFGVTRIRQLVYWRDYAPSSGAKRKPRFDASDPNAYPADTWDSLDALVSAGGARGIALTLTLTGPAPRWAAHDKAGLSRPSAREFGAFATAIGRRYGDAVDT